MPLLDDIQRVWRRFQRYTGDGLPNPPVGHPLSSGGDPRSGIYNPDKTEIRDLLVSIAQSLGDPSALASILTQLDGKAEDADVTAVLRNAGVITLTNVAGSGNTITAEFPAALAPILGTGIPSGLIIGFVSPVTTNGASTLTIGVDTADLRRSGGLNLTGDYNLIAGEFVTFERFGSQWRWRLGDASLPRVTGLVAAAEVRAISTGVNTLAKGRSRARGGAVIAHGDKPGPGGGLPEAIVVHDDLTTDLLASALTAAGLGLYMPGRGRAPLRSRPAFVAVEDDGRIGILAAWDAAGRLQGPFDVISNDGRGGGYTVPGQFEGHMLGASAVRSGAVGTWRMNTAAIVGIIGYGQSWMVSNGSNGALPEFTTAPLPEFAMTLNDGRGVSGWNGAAPTADVSDLTDAREQITQYQSVVGPMAWRYSYLQQRAGGDATVFVRTEARAGYSLARLAPPDFSWHDSTITDRPYLNFLRAVQGFKDAADALGQPFELVVIPFIQGQADKSMDYATYRGRLVELADRMIADAMTITGQRRRPQFLIVQCPSDDTNGQWPLLKAQVDLCHERADFTLCGAGWPIPQKDGTHFTAEGAPAVGEMLELAMRAYMTGVPYSAPYLNDAAISRNGTTITCHILGDYRVRDETGIITKRHYLSDLTAPVPHLGFEYSGAAIIDAKIAADGRTITITLDADAPGRLWYAGHGARRGASGVVVNESVNRGTLIADIEIPPVYSTERLTLGLASYYKDL